MATTQEMAQQMAQDKTGIHTASQNTPFHANNGNPNTIYNQTPNGGYLPPVTDARDNWRINAGGGSGSPVTGGWVPPTPTWGAPTPTVPGGGGTFPLNPWTPPTQLQPTPTVPGGAMPPATVPTNPLPIGSGVTGGFPSAYGGFGGSGWDMQGRAITRVDIPAANNALPQWASFNTTRSGNPFSGMNGQMDSATAGIREAASGMLSQMGEIGGLLKEQAGNLLEQFGFLKPDGSVDLMQILDAAILPGDAWNNGRMQPANAILGMIGNIFPQFRAITSALARRIPDRARTGTVDVGAISDASVPLPAAPGSLGMFGGGAGYGDAGGAWSGGMNGGGFNAGFGSYGGGFGTGSSFGDWGSGWGAGATSGPMDMPTGFGAFNPSAAPATAPAAGPTGGAAGPTGGAGFGGGGGGYEGGGGDRGGAWEGLSGTGATSGSHPWERYLARQSRS